MQEETRDPSAPSPAPLAPGGKFHFQQGRIKCGGRMFSTQGNGEGAGRVKGKSKDAALYQKDILWEWNIFIKICSNVQNSVLPRLKTDIGKFCKTVTKDSADLIKEKRECDKGMTRTTRVFVISLFCSYLDFGKEVSLLNKFSRGLGWTNSCIAYSRPRILLSGWNRFHPDGWMDIV